MRYRSNAYRARRWAAAGVVVAAAVSALSGPAEAQEAQPAPGAVLPAAAGGDAVVRQLGAQIDAVAARNGMSGAELADLLRSDLATRLDRGGRLFYIDAPAPAVAAAPPVALGPFPDSQTFLLHSKPGSKRVIFLDFDGFVLAAGNVWGVASAVGWDGDGDPASFGPSELARIQGIWQRVAEDYAPFDVDVTTQDPGFAAIHRTNAADLTFGARAVITSDAAFYETICKSTCGGVAYIGSFDETVAHDTYQPAWVFAEGLGPDNEKYIAEAVSHEVGHNIGLEHDGTAAAVYYEGRTPWAPIMGSGYYHPISQWSNGQYVGANNTQDDFAVAAANGLAIRADDAGGTTATARSLGSSTTFNATGIISSAADKDVFSIAPACAGNIVVTLTTAVNSPNLDARLRLLNSAGTEVATDNPAAAELNHDLATGLGASIVYAASAGTYYVEVDGIGLPTPPVTGYPDYGSVGQFSISGSQCAGALTCNGLAVTVNLALGQAPTAGDDVILGTPGDDTVNALGGNDTICGGGGNDVLAGQGGNDTVLGEAGLDRVSGGPGNDTLIGGLGNDTLVPGLNTDSVNGGDGVDLVSFSDATAAVTVNLLKGTATGGAGSDSLAQIESILGSKYNDSLSGSAAINRITGGAGRDTLAGFGANDTLIGGTGADSMSGGAGADSCDGSTDADVDTADASCDKVVNVP